MSFLTSILNAREVEFFALKITFACWLHVWCIFYFNNANFIRPNSLICTLFFTRGEIQLFYWTIMKKLTLISDVDLWIKKSLFSELTIYFRDPRQFKRWHCDKLTFLAPSHMFRFCKDDLAIYPQPIWEAASIELLLFINFKTISSINLFDFTHVLC